MSLYEVSVTWPRPASIVQERVWKHYILPINCIYGSTAGTIGTTDVLVIIYIYIWYNRNKR